MANLHKPTPPRVTPIAGFRRIPPSILLIDDDESVRHSLGRFLTMATLQVVMARGVKDALDRVERSTPDLIITDLRMAPLSRWDLMVHLQNHFPALPVFVVSALAPNEAGGALHCAAAYFQKPLDLDSLLAAIRRQLDL